MKPELEQLKSLTYDSVNQDVYSVYMSLVRYGREECNYRYDKKEGLIYTEHEENRPRYTYIAKAKGLDMYKIGHTANLGKRVPKLRSMHPYSLLDLNPIAYTAEDVEQEILAMYGCFFRKLPKPFDVARELVLLDEPGVQWLINTYSFTRVTPGCLPGEMKKTTRYYFDPDNGEYVGTKIITTFDNTGEQFTRIYNFNDYE